LLDSLEFLEAGAERLVRHIHFFRQIVATATVSELRSIFCSTQARATSRGRREQQVLESTRRGEDWVKNQTAANPAYVNFPNFFDRTILAVALEPFRREFGLDDTSLGLYVAAGTSLGYLADRYNRKVIITIALIVWSVMTGVTGIAWSFPGFGTIVTGALSDMFARNAMAAARAAEMTEAFHAEGLHSVILFVVPFGMLTTAIFLRKRLRERHRISRDTDSSNDWRRKWTRLRSLISTFQRFLASSACPAST
jgi:hypothetical protein